MNKKQAMKWIGKELRIRPIAIQLTEAGERLEQDDDKWLISDVSDAIVRMSNVRTGHVWELGLDNVREYRTPDFLLLQCQVILKGQFVKSESIIMISANRNLTGFESLLKYSWVKEFIGGREIWISEVDNMFQIELGNNDRNFNEEWTHRFPDHENSFAFPVTLKIQGVEIKQFTFIACDGGRIVVPMPRNSLIHEKRVFIYDRHSLEYKIGQIIGSFYIYQTLERVASHAEIVVS